MSSLAPWTNLNRSCYDKLYALKRGERGQVVKAEVCGTSIRGFKSRRSPFYIPKIFGNDIFIVIADYFR
jgi:hypothetical protein